MRCQCQDGPSELPKRQFQSTLCGLQFSAHVLSVHLCTNFPNYQGYLLSLIRLPHKLFLLLLCLELTQLTYPRILNNLISGNTYICSINLGKGYFQTWTVQSGTLLETRCLGRSNLHDIYDHHSLLRITPY